MRLSYSINLLFNFYFFLIIFRCFLSFIPNLDYEQQPLKFLISIIEPYLNIFRKIIPPLNGLDFSPIIALIVLQVVQRIIVSALLTYGL